MITVVMVTVEQQACPHPQEFHLGSLPELICVRSQVRSREYTCAEPRRPTGTDRDPCL
jgi:hypothetical protein